MEDSNFPSEEYSPNSPSNFPIDATPSYLIGADNHQLGGNNNSILNPDTWGDRVDNGFKFSVGVMTRAATSTVNSAVAVGELLGVADKSNEVSTKDWLEGMDDDLGKYYTQNQQIIDTVGDVVGMFAPGLAGMKVLNIAQKGVELATEGRAGLNMAAYFGTLPTKQAMFAKMAAQDIANGTPYNLINANLAKSIAAGFAQNGLEMAAFNTAAAVTMKNFSPMFDKEDMSDIVYNSFLGGGLVGGGIMGTVVGVKTISAYRKAGNALEEATNAYRTALTTPAEGTAASESLAIHLNNIEAAPTVAADDILASAKLRGVNNLVQQEENKGRLAAHKLVGEDNTMGNTLYDVMSLADSESAATKLAGAVKVVRAGQDTAEEELIRKSIIDTTAPAKTVSDLEDKLGKTDVTSSAYNDIKQKLFNAKNKLADIVESKQSQETSPFAVQYIKLFGEDAGSIYDTPNTLTIADKVKGNEESIMSRVNEFKHKQGQDWNVISSQSPDATEARYITALEKDFDPSVSIGTKDIPYLERAYMEMKAGHIQEVTLKDGTLLDKPALFYHLYDIKGEAANLLGKEGLLNLGEKSAFTTEDIAKLTNVSPSYLKGMSNAENAERDIFAMQNAANDYTDKMVAANKWNADKGVIKTYLQPQTGKIVYNTESAAGITGHQISGMVALKEQQEIYRQSALNVTNQYFGNWASRFIARIPGVLMPTANRESVGGGLFSSMNGNYATLASLCQNIGKDTSEWLSKKANDMAERFAPSGHAILNDSDAGLEFTKIAQQLRQTPEAYQYVQGRGLVNMKQIAYETKIAATSAAGGDISKIATPEFEDVNAPVEIPITTPGVTQFVQDWDKYHKSHMSSVINLRNSQGINVQDSLMDKFYIPPVDSRRFPHFAFVVDNSVNSTGHMSMLHANTAEQLEELASKVPTDKGFKVIYKDQSEEWHQAMKNYDYDLAINENYVNTALKRSGVSAPTYPVTDPKVLWDELMQWRQSNDAGLARDMLEHRYSPEFEELRSQGKQFDLANTSVKQYVSDKLKGQASNPYTDYIKAALYQSREGTTPIWSALNRLAETSVSSAVTKLQNAFEGAKSADDLIKINEMLKGIGVSTYQDAATYALANHTAPKAILSNWIRKADSLLTFTMLKSDPMNALNNGLGHSVLYGTELPNLIREVMSNPAMQNAAMSDLTHITVPGTTSQVMSPMKMAAAAHAAWWDKVIGGQDGGKLYEWAKVNGYLPSYTDQFKAMADNLTLRGTESVTQLDGMMNTAFAAAKKIDEMGAKYSGNNYIEEFNRFRSAVTAKLITDEAIKAGAIPKEIAPSIINTFTNRVEGVHLAAQRPLMFKGAIGQALGLFQTYQFNMLQQMLRHVGDGNTKSIATMLGLQGSIYGMNGLPAFNAMNTYIIGNAAGNQSHADIVSKTYDAAGKEAGDWLLYGFSSNMLLHPDAKINMYSRGDINPRQVTVIPTNVADVPIVGAATKFFGSMYETMQKINNGAPMWNSLLQGIEHSGVSRPLSGFAQAMEATTNPNSKVFSTDNNGNIVMENDLYSAMTAARLVGAKPLDEAVALDAFHRVQVYNASNMKKIETLGESIKATVAGGSVPSQETVAQFASEYAAVGGKQQQFNQFYTKQVLNANRSKVNQMIANGDTFQSRYMQKIMGGYDLQDFNNDTGGNQ